jgi:hypothetical protein
MAWFNPAWRYRIPVTVDNTANATSALAYYQVGISLTGAAYTSINAHAKADRSDLRVTDSDGVTLLSFALEGNDTVNSAVYLLVKVPRVAAASTSTIYIYYGNAAATSVSSYPNTVGPATALVGPADIFSQSDAANLNNNSVILRLRHQDQSGGGGSSLNGEMHCYVNNQATNASVADAVIWQLRSTDGGVTWPAKTQILIPATSHAASVQTVLELANGNILIFYHYDLNTQYPLSQESGYVGRSTDGGRTWTNLSTSPANPMTVPSGYGSAGVLYGNAIEVSAGGDILKPWYGVKTGNSVTGSYLLRCPSGSDPTNGTNWSLLGTIAYDGTNAFSETAIIQTTDANHLIAIYRNDSATGLYRCSSADGGATWGAPAALNGPMAVNKNCGGISPFLLKLASGNILLMAGVRNNATAASGSLIWASTDNGVNWFDRPGQNPWNYAPNLADGGYPGADQRADGTIVSACYYEVGGNVNTANIGRVIFTEDYAFNASNQYDACESFTAPWTVHEANLSIDATHVHNGTNAIKADNSAGHAVIGRRVCWPSDAGQLPQGIAYSSWIYATQNAGNISWAVTNSTPANRQQCYVNGVAGTQDVMVWVSSYIDSTVVAPLNRWNKHTVYANMPVATASMTGTHAMLNNAALTPQPGNVSTNIGAAANLNFQFGNEAANSATTAWLDDVYTHQYTANIPVTTAGVEQFNPGSAGILLGL